MDIDKNWLPVVPMKRVILHWTAGTHKANSTDLKAYHLLVEGDGKVVRGNASIALNSTPLKTGYAAHTLNANSESIGISLCCMGNATEVPFNAGKWPMTKKQFDTLIELVRIVCEAYKIPITPKTVLTHAEVQNNLGIQQRNKWDYTRLAFDPSLVGAKAIGDHIRERVATVPTTESLPPLPDGAQLVAINFAGTMTGNRNPTFSRPNRVLDNAVGAVPVGLTLQLTGANDDGSWLSIVTPAGYQGWVQRASVKLVDAPTPEMPTTPNPLRVKLNEIRRLLDELEAEL